MKPITNEMTQNLNKSYLENEKHRVLKAALVEHGLDTVTTQFEKQNEQQFIFSNEIRTLPVTNQMQSGRCWLFAGLNILREVVALKHDLKAFELSQSYLAFWDKFEKVNFFIESMDDFIDVDADDRTFAFLLKEGIQDGGQWDMFVALVEKYGVVPKSVMPESFQSSHTPFLNKLLNFRLRKYVSDLRSKKYDASILKQRVLSEVHHLLVSSYGMPPANFNFEYIDQSGAYHLYKDLTPLTFYENHVGLNLSDYLSIIHAPTKDKPFYQTYTVDYLGNVVGGKQVIHLNVPLDVFKELTVKQLVNKELVWFGCDVANYGNRKKGIWDDQSFDYQNVLGLDLAMSKEDKLTFLQSQMNHAMVLTGVHIVDGEIMRFKIQNSWGAENGNSGFYLASNSWFDAYAYQVVIHKQYLNDKLKQALKKEVIHLNPWDPMGSLA